MKRANFVRNAIEGKRGGGKKGGRGENYTVIWEKGLYTETQAS